jgi:hypothetical protein
MSQRQHLMVVQQATGLVPERLLYAPKCPESLAYLWSLFARLRARCTPSMGVPRILYTDILAFMQVTGQRLTAWDVSVIERLDDAFVDASRGS